MLCDKPVVNTLWDPITMSRDDLIPYDDRGVVLPVYNKDELGAEILSIVKDGYEITPQMKEDSDSFIYDYCFKQDGKAGERVAKLIDEMLEEFYG